MKILTANFVTCAVKACKSSPESFPLHFRDAELEQTDMEFNPTFLRNILPRIEWDALRTTAEETKPEVSGLDAAAEEGPQADNQPVAVDSGAESQDKLWKDLHKLLFETQVVEGKLVCGHCGHEYRIKEGIANFLLPNHLV
ncbi:MAG: hypothetical protein MMC23_002178 [Stictis urceolatum]|nr:hypothetical protein [Stictis urceolata]